MIYVLNTLIVPIDFSKHPQATVRFTRISVEEARELLKQQFVSAVGHEATANLLSKLLSTPIPANRVTVFMNPGDVGVHFFLRSRIPEGKVLSLEELEKLDYWLVKSEVL
jgi:hypothetical protein